MATRTLLQLARISSPLQNSSLRPVFSRGHTSLRSRFRASFETPSQTRFFAHGPNCRVSQTTSPVHPSRGSPCSHSPTVSLNEEKPITKTQEGPRLSNPCAPCPAVKGSAECHASQCWSCAHFLEKSQVFCMKCSRIQPPQNMTYFEMFGMNTSFTMDLDQLQKKYWQLSKQVHPDRFNRGTEQEQNFSASQTMNLNHAYNTLKQPHLRAIYLLGLRGITVSESESITDEEFLMEIMEIREAVESAESVDELQQLKKENEGRIGTCLVRLDASFRQENWTAAKEILYPLQYYMKIRETITEKLPM